MNHFADFVAEPTLWFLADWSVRWGVLIGVLAVWLLVFRPRRTATRYLVCWAVLLSGLCLPLLPRWGPGIPLAVSLPEERARDVITEPILPDPSKTAPIEYRDDKALIYQPGAPAMGVSTDPSLALRAGDASLTDKSIASELDIPASGEPLGMRRVVVLSIAALWVGGIAIYLLRWAAGCWLLGRLRRSVVPLSGRAAAIFADCVNELAVQRRIGFAAHPHVRSPVSLGLFHPIVIVPSDWTMQSEHVQRSSLLHEIAHLARYDDGLAILMEIVRTVFWFHPLVHWLLNRIEHERELRCDETAVSRGIDPRQYAQVLLDFARQPGRLLPAALASPSYPLRIGRRRTVKARIEHLLEDNMQRWITPLSRGRVIALAVIVLATAAGLGCVRVQSAPDAPDEPVSSQTVETPPTEQGNATQAGSSYRIKPFDVLSVGLGPVEVLTKLDLRGDYLVEPDGRVYLGPFYGRVKLGGLTVDEAEAVVREQVGKILEATPSLSVAGWVTKWQRDPSRTAPYRIKSRHVLNINLNADVLSALKLNGAYVVDLDGRVALGPPYGRVKLADLTLDEATKTVDDIVSKFIESPKIALTMSGWEKDWQRLEDDDKPASAAGPLPKFQKDDLRYGGKSFDQWRRDLLIELKPDIRVDGIRAMAEFGANGYGAESIVVIGEIVRGLDTTDRNRFQVQEAVRTAVRRIGPPAAPHLVRSLKSSDAETRKFAASAIWLIIPPPKEAISGLVDLMSDEDPETRAHAIAAALSIDFESPEVQKALAKALKDKPRVRKSAVDHIRIKESTKVAVPLLAEALTDSGPETLNQIITILAGVGPAAQAAIPALIELVKKDDDRLADQAMTAVKKIETNDTRLANLLVEMLKTASIDRRKTQPSRRTGFDRAYSALIGMGKEAKGAVPSLIELTKTGDSERRLHAISALAEIGPDAGEAIPELERVRDSNDPSTSLHVAATKALAEIKRRGN